MYTFRCNVTVVVETRCSFLFLTVQLPWLSIQIATTAYFQMCVTVVEIQCCSYLECSVTMAIDRLC